MNLADYERRKFDLAEILRGVAAVQPPRQPGQDDPIQALFARLAEDRFNLAVVGRFSRGKSSLMNAILGLDRLPTGIIPLTSVITSVSYGSEEQVELTFEGISFNSRISLAELPRYVTQEGNPGNVQRVKMAEVQLPAEILRRGFYFVDTPGLGSPTLANTRTTESFLPAADAFLLVTSYDGPFSEDEIRFLRTAQPTARRIFVAINKQDAVDRTERDHVMGYVRSVLQSLFGTAPPQVFSTSAIEGLKAKQTMDHSRLLESGVEALEQALVNFLVTDKSQEFLLRMCDRVSYLAHGLPRSDERQALCSRLEEIRAELSGPGAQTSRHSAVGGLAPSLSEAAGGCQICHAIEWAAFEFLRRHQYDLTVNQSEQESLAEAGGLCALHTWTYHNLASPLGMSIGYPRLLERWRDELSRLGDVAGLTSVAAESAIESQLPTQCSCVVCRTCSAAQSQALSTAAERLHDGHAAVIDSLSAICLGHLALLIGRIRDETVLRSLLRRQAGLFERFAEDMRRYALKRDGLRRDLASDAENRSPDRALGLLAGLPNISFVRQID